MINNIINYTFFTIIAGACLILMVGAIISDQTHDPEDWIVADRFKAMSNPVEMTTRSINMGSTLFRRNCRNCHGAEGKGDGPDASDLNTELRGFDTEKVQSQSDGELFYKTREGRDEMPGMASDLYDEDIWHIVNFIRTLKAEE